MPYGAACKGRVMLAFMAVLAMFWAAPTSYAQALKQCPSADPDVNFSTATSGTQYVRTRSSQDLTRMHGNPYGNTMVGGLGGGELGFQTQARYEILTQGGAACLRLKRVDVLFYARPKIHIASNFSRASCEYGAVMGHEKKHVAELLKFHREYAPRARRELDRILKSIPVSMGPMPRATADKAQDVMQSRIAAGLAAYNKKLTPLLEQRQGKIDTPDEYARVSAQCDDWNDRLGAK